jgi:hypothetical protein
MLAIRLPCVTITPLGCDVEPDVYCRKASVSSFKSGSRHADGFRLSRASVASQGIDTSCGKRLFARSAIDSMDETVSTSAGAELSMIASSRGISSPDGLGGYTGTAITPAYRQPKNAAMKSSPGG